MKYDDALKKTARFFEESGLEFKIHIKSPSAPLNLRNHITYHSWYELMFIPYDGLVHYVNGKIVELPPNSLCLIRPADVCDFKMTSHYDKLHYIYQLTIEDWLMHAIFQFLSPDMPVTELLESELPPRAVLNQIDALNLLNRFSYINTFEPSQHKQAALEIKDIVISLLVKHFYFFSKNEIPSDNTIPLWLQRTVNAMRISENFSVGVPRMVELCGKTNEHLSRSMQKYYNISPIEYINNVRSAYAANLLINSSLSITDICFECGFQSISWMGIQFKKKYGVTPSEYRKSCTLLPPLKKH